MTMTPKWKILISAIFLVVTILFFAPLNNAVAQTTQTMLLTNGDFEQGLSDWATFGASPSGHEGRSGAGAYWRANGFAGIYQQAAVTPGTTVRLSAWTKGWSGNDENSLSDEAWMRQRIGIDPTGGTDPNSPNIAWSLPAQLTQWGQLAVEVAATSEQVTVFLAADPDKERPFNDIYYDDATLSLVAFPAPTAQPLPAPTVDPLVIGLVDGAGAAPGTQGIRVSESNNTNHSLFIDKLVLLGALGAIWASVLIVSYFFSAHKRKRF